MPYKVRFNQPGDIEALTAVDTAVTVRVSGDDTDGEYELLDIDGVRGAGAPLSRHPWSEAYYVLDGTVEVTVGAQTRSLGTGGCALIPPNAAHSFVIVSDTARMLVVSATGAASRFFADLDANVHLADGPAVFVPRIGEVAERNQVTLLAGAPA